MPAAPVPELSLDYRPRLPRRMDFRIGCIGAGFIMRDCHLVAYRQAGFNPVAIASRNPSRAQAVAAECGIPHCYATCAELLADREIEVLDIAVPPDVQPGIIREAVQHGDHIRGILAQKPLAMSYPEAKECVDLCTGAGIVLAVNQNMRYDQSVRALCDILRRAWPGAPSVGRAIRRERRAHSISPPGNSPAGGSSRAGKRCGFLTPLSAPWRNCCVHSKKEPSRRSAAGTICKRSRYARQSMPLR